MKQANALLVIIIINNLIFVNLTIAGSKRVYYDVINHSYMRIDTKKNWYEAKKYCEKMGGYLATITSKGENDFIFNTLIKRSRKSCWLGGTDVKNEGEWESHRSTSVCTVKYHKIQAVINNYYDLLIIYISS